MKTHNVLIAEELSPATVSALGDDFVIRHVDGTVRSELLRELVDAHAVLIRSATQMDAEALAVAKKLKVIARAGVGLDNVDIKAATEAGVMVVNAPHLEHCQCRRAGHRPHSRARTSHSSCACFARRW